MDVGSVASGAHFKVPTSDAPEKPGSDTSMLLMTNSVEGFTHKLLDRGVKSRQVSIADDADWFDFKGQCSDADLKAALLQEKKLFNKDCHEYFLRDQNVHILGFSDLFKVLNGLKAGDYDESIIRFWKDKVEVSAEYRYARCLLFIRLGYLYCANDQYDYAETEFFRALVNVEGDTRPEDLSAIYYGIFMVFHCTSRHEKAMHYLDLAQKYSNVDAIWYLILIKLGVVSIYQAHADLGIALSLLKKLSESMASQGWTRFNPVADIGRYVGGYWHALHGVFKYSVDIQDNIKKVEHFIGLLEKNGQDRDAVVSGVALLRCVNCV